MAVVRARVSGVCVLALRNSAHIGRIGAYAELATAAGCAFTAFVNVADYPFSHAPFGTLWSCSGFSSAFLKLLPFQIPSMKHVCAFPGARDARLGTNPFCAALPRGAAAAGAAEPPLLLDMATTTIASGKARVAYGDHAPSARTRSKHRN